MNDTKDPRWPKQFGDFGEHLVMYLIGMQKNMKVALVDHAGADLIASDLNSKDSNKEIKRYAISVKSHTLNIKESEKKDSVSVESKLYNFKEGDIEMFLFSY